MKNCAFCQIAKNLKEQEYRTIFSNKEYLGMLVSHPETKGHFIVFPKIHCSELTKLKGRGGLFKLTIELAEKITKKLGAKAYTLKVNNKVFMLETDPLHIGHIHIHIIPRYSENDLINSKPDEIAKQSLFKIKSGLLF